MKKNHLCTSYHKFYIKDKDIKNHWVVHSKMKPIGVDEFFSRNIVINELESILNKDDKTEASVAAED